jgi:hypothetical protein
MNKKTFFWQIDTPMKLSLHSDAPRTRMESTSLYISGRKADLACTLTRKALTRMRQSPSPYFDRAPLHLGVATSHKIFPGRRSNPWPASGFNANLKIHAWNR